MLCVSQLLFYGDINIMIYGIREFSTFLAWSDAVERRYETILRTFEQKAQKIVESEIVPVLNNLKSAIETCERTVEVLPDVDRVCINIIREGKCEFKYAVTTKYYELGYRFFAIDNHVPGERMLHRAIVNDFFETPEFIFDANYVLDDFVERFKEVKRQNRFAMWSSCLTAQTLYEEIS